MFLPIIALAAAIILIMRPEPNGCNGALSKIVFLKVNNARSQFVLISTLLHINVRVDKPL